MLTSGVRLNIIQSNNNTTVMVHCGECDHVLLAATITDDGISINRYRRCDHLKPMVWSLGDSPEEVSEFEEIDRDFTNLFLSIVQK